MDDDKRYNVVLTGRLRPKKRHEDVVAAVARLYRVDPARIERTFARAPRVIKPAVPRQKATKYLLALSRAGAEVVIEPVSGAAVAVPARGTRAERPAPVTQPVPAPGAVGASPSGAAATPESASPRPSTPAPEAAAGPASAPVVAAPTAPPVMTGSDGGMVSGPDSLPLTDSSGFGRARLLSALAAAIAVVIGIGAGGWYLLGPEPPPSAPEPATAVPAPVAAPGPDVIPASVARSAAPPDERSAEPQQTAAPDAAAANSAATVVPLAGDSGAADIPAGANGMPRVSTDGGLTGMDLTAPFGLRMGARIEQLPVGAEPVAADHYHLADVPQPLAAFTDYGVRIGPDRGLCGVRATGVVAGTAADGRALRAAFGAMEAELTARLGPALHTDVLLAESPFTAPDDWLLALEQRQRYLFSVWSGLSGARLPTDVRRVTLRAGAESAATGHVTIEIAFRNEVACNQSAGLRAGDE